jgi:hypothetical protein
MIIAWPTENWICLLPDRDTERAEDQFMHGKGKTESPRVLLQEPRRKYLGVGFKPKTQRWYAQLRNGKEVSPESPGLVSQLIHTQLEALNHQAMCYSVDTYASLCLNPP